MFDFDLSEENEDAKIDSEFICIKCNGFGNP